MQASLDTWGNAHSWPSWPGTNGMNVDQVLVDMRDAIIGGADVDTTIKETQEQVNELLK